MVRSVVPSGIKREQLKLCLREATREKYPETEHWNKLASITELAFRDGHILEALACTNMVLIPNSEGG